MVHLADFDLSYMGQESKLPEKVKAPLELEFAASKVVDSLEENIEVARAVRLLMNTRARREAIEHLDRHDVASAKMGIQVHVDRLPKFPIMISAENHRDRVLTHDEEYRLLSVCEGEREHLRVLIVIAIDTGLRKGEILSLERRHIDMEAERIQVSVFNAKTERARQVGMTPRIKEALSKHLEKLDGDRLFEFKDFKRSFATACRMAKVEKFLFHDLRHSATTRMVRAGIPASEVMKTTGHSRLQTFLRYVNLIDSTVTSNANRLAEFNATQTFEADSVN